MKRNYKSKSVVIAASGAIKHSKLVRLAKEKFSFVKGEAETGSPAKRDFKQKVTVEPNGLNQTHVCVGMPGVDYKDKDRTTALAISSYLGGGMSSVLFQKIREQKGLAYSVYTYHETYRDAGIFGAYLATTPNGAGQSLAIITKEYEKLKKKKLSKKDLDQVKAQLKGNLTLGMESTSARMNRLARQELYFGDAGTLRRDHR